MSSAVQAVYYVTMHEHKKENWSLMGSGTDHRLFADRVEAIDVDAKLHFRRSIYSQTHPAIDRRLQLPGTEKGI